MSYVIVAAVSFMLGAVIGLFVAALCAVSKASEYHVEEGIADE